MNSPQKHYRCFYFYLKWVTSIYNVDDSAFLSRKHLDKHTCLCYYISCKWHAFICSDIIFRGIAQLVEQRSPNVNAAMNIRINTELSRLGTSVSSLFSCFEFCKSVKWFMQNRGRNLQKISEQHQKTSNISLGQKGRFSHAWKIPTDIWMILSGLSFSTPP